MKITDVVCVSELPRKVEHESLALMSQPLDEDDNAYIPLTYESPSQLQIVDLHSNIY